MIYGDKRDQFIDRFITRIFTCSPIVVIILTSLVVSFLSALIVFVFTSLCGEEHTLQLYRFAIVIPLLTTPVIVSILFMLIKHIKHFKEMLEEEIEESKKKDIILFEQARFVLMGEMMANISHQWKQPLNTIALAVVSAKTSKKAGNNFDRSFDIIEDNVNYLASTIDDFMSFFDQKTNLELRNIDSIVKEIKSIIEVQFKNKDIDLRFEINDNAKDVMIVSSISQVILNLLNNSKDSFSEDFEYKKISVIFTVKESVLEILCRDNGKGIALEIQDKIFDPYFTTKDKTQGTGIGLYMSKQIIQKLFNGTIEISSKRSIIEECGQETCFYIDIPYSDKCVLKENIG